VGLETVYKFDGAVMGSNSELGKCPTLIVGDCSEHARFAVLAQRTNSGDNMVQLQRYL